MLSWDDYEETPSNAQADQAVIADAVQTVSYTHLTLPTTEYV